ncbi:hypothetical protein ACHAWF_001631 [Thalassiosira exigua]
MHRIGVWPSIKKHPNPSPSASGSASRQKRGASIGSTIMDLLATLGLGSSLPEQSTRLTSHPGIARALDGGGEAGGGEGGGVRLGFDACLRCGTGLPPDDDGYGDGDAPSATHKKEKTKRKKRTAKPATCEGCRRVRYCSAACRKADSEEPRESTNEEEEAACGHSPVICALLNLCNDDDDVEEEVYAELSGARKGKKRRRRDDDQGGDAAKQSGPKGQKREAAKYRVRTELESYPATLFGALADGPQWLTEALTRRLRQGEDVRSPEAKRIRRGKRDRNHFHSSAERTEEASGRSRELVLHVVGASRDAELWGWDGNGNAPVLEAYAEASSNLTSYLRTLLEANVSIRCAFVGPDCPGDCPRAKVPIPDAPSSKLTIEAHRGRYGGPGRPKLPTPDAIVFFNPGLSCGDYDWSEALKAAVAYQRSTSEKIPFVVATNTELEGYADLRYLLEGGHLDPASLPADILEAADWPSGNDDGDEEHAFFFGENPYAGLRVRQSGTMGNDLYVKNRWILGGTLGRGGIRGGGGRGVTAPEEKGKGARASGRDGDGDDDEGGGRERKRRRREQRGGDVKRRNPALI